MSRKNQERPKQYISYECALLVTPKLAAAINLGRAAGLGPDGMCPGMRVPRYDGIPDDDIKKALENQTPPYEVASDRFLSHAIRAYGLDNLHDAVSVMDYLWQDAAYYPDISGTARPSGQFVKKPGPILKFQCEGAAWFLPKKRPALFERPYKSRKELVTEYASRLEPIAGPGVPWPYLIYDLDFYRYS